MLGTRLIIVFDSGDWIANLVAPGLLELLLSALPLLPQLFLFISVHVGLPLCHRFLTLVVASLAMRCSLFECDWAFFYLAIVDVSSVPKLLIVLLAGMTHRSESLGVLRLLDHVPDAFLVGVICFLHFFDVLDDILLLDQRL